MIAAQTAPPVIQLRPEDNVAVATRPLRRGMPLGIGGAELHLTEDVPMGHKVAIRPIAAGQPIRKFGQTIGFASRAIEPGGWVHVHNVSAERFERDYAFCTEVPETPVPDRIDCFAGYARPDGRVGTRNYIAVVSTVNCSATTCRYIASRFGPERLRDFPTLDGVMAVTHKGGCGMQFGGVDHNQLSRVLAGFARHPNIAAYLLVGLGCETGQASYLIENQGLVQIRDLASARPNGGPPLITIQDSGGITKTVEAGVRAVEQLLPVAAACRRTVQPASKIILGTNCGGSDGNSGITANPALGSAADRIVSQGGTVILGETTEIYGAEHLLTRRAIRRAVGEALVERIKWWEWYAGIFGAEINNNPSPGNKAGGLTTIYEKSLGAVAKGGTTALREVVHYGQQVRGPGLVVMDTPGLDNVSVTGIVAGGANVMVFTTGRGSVFGCKPTPSIKVATNSPMYFHMEPDMDLNAGVILEGTPLDEVARQIYAEVLAVAGGKKTKSEELGVGEEEFSPWVIGPVL